MSGHWKKNVHENVSGLRTAELEPRGVSLLKDTGTSGLGGHTTWEAPGSRPKGLPPGSNLPYETLNEFASGDTSCRPLPDHSD